MERGVQLIDFVETDSMVVIHDYHNASLFGRSSNAKAATKEIIKIMQDNYPEFLVSPSPPPPFPSFARQDKLTNTLIVRQVFCQCTLLGKVNLLFLFTSVYC